MSPFSFPESPMSHFEPEFFSSSSSSTASSPSQYFPNADFGLAMKPYHDLPNLAQGFSPISSAGSSLGRSTSLGPSSKAASRSPPTRQRTPIRHPRLSTSRVRPEALLAYATQEEPPQTINYPNSFSVSSSYSTPFYGSSISQPASYSFSQPESNPPSYIGRSHSYSLDSADTFQYPSSVPSTWTPAQSMVLPPPTGYVPRQNPMESDVRVLHQRPKPTCWEHGCNGRQFSTFSNLLRHQREKSGNASKHECPQCGTEFTRTTARRGHMEGGKCKGQQAREARTRET